MKVHKEEIPLTGWAKVKDKSAQVLGLLLAKTFAKWQLIKVFLIKFFDIKQLAFATFTYDLICGHKNPKREKHIVLARISRNATSAEVTNKLFTLKPPADDCKLKVVEVKIQGVGKVKSV